MLIFFEVVVKVRPTTQLQDCAEAIVIDFNGIKMLHYSPMVELLVDLVLSQRVLDVIILDLVAPAVIEVVNLAGHLPKLVQIECLIDL